MTEKYLIISENCTGCEKLKDELKREGLLKTFDVKDLQEDDEAIDIVMSMDEMYVPMCVVKNDGTYRECTDEEWAKDI